MFTRFYRAWARFLSIPLIILLVLTGMSIPSFAYSTTSSNYTTYINVSWVCNYGLPLTYNYSTQYYLGWNYYNTYYRTPFDYVYHYMVVGDLCGEPPVDSFAVQGNTNEFTDSYGDKSTIYQSQLTFQPLLSNCPYWEGGYINPSYGSILLVAYSKAVQATVSWQVDSYPGGSPDWSCIYPAIGNATSPKFGF